MNYTLPLAGRAKDLVGSMIDSSTSLLASQTHDIVRFAMGSPAPDSIPAQALSQLAPEAMGKLLVAAEPLLLVENRGGAGGAGRRMGLAMTPMQAHRHEYVCRPMHVRERALPWPPIQARRRFGLRESPVSRGTPDQLECSTNIDWRGKC